MKPITFLTANQGKHREVQRLLSGLDVRWARLDLARPDTDDLEAIARARVGEAYARLGERCFLENTGLYLYEHGGAPGASFKKIWRELGEDGFAARYGGSSGVARVVVAYADGDAVRSFEGSSAGTLLRAPRGREDDPERYGWDRLWVPDGYDRTLGEMGGSTYVVNMRAAPYLDLADHLRGRRTAGSFEAHVTVAPCAIEPFRAACGDLGVKCIAIELGSSSSPENLQQPMTASFHRGELRDVQAEALAIGRELVRRGFTVTRTKIEQHGRLEGTPETDDEARAAPKTSYFEFHVKIAPPPDADLAAIATDLRKLGAHLSRNAQKSGERFVTLRAHGVGRATAEARFAAVCAEIERLGLPARSRIREYTVFDTNLELDRGWA